MPTKLKTPITITLDTVEEAIGLFHNANAGFEGCWQAYVEHHKREMPTLGQNSFLRSCFLAGTSVFDTLRTAIEAQAIDLWNWQPPKPLLAAGHPVECNADGSVKVGCTTLTAAEVEAIIARRNEVAVWPKYWSDGSRCANPYRKDADGTIHYWSHHDLVWHREETITEEVLERSEYKPITAAEAKALGAEI